MTFVAPSPADSGPPELAPRHGPVTLTTESVDARERFGFWREVVCHQFAKLDARPVAPIERFHGSVTAVAAGPVHLSRIRAAAHTGLRTTRTIADADQASFVIGLVVKGACAVEQADRVAVQNTGDLILTDTTRPFTVQSDGDFDAFVLQVPHKMFQAVLPRADAVSATPAGGQSRLVGSLLGRIMEAAATASPAALRHLTNAAVELVAASLADVTAQATGGSMRAANLVRAHQYIEQHLWDPELSPDSVARAVLVSPRYMQALFRDSGISVSRYVMERRLERAHRDLTEPALAHLSIGDVASRLGFKRLSHFTHVFKNRFGICPRDHRAGRSSRTGQR
jgi:AraC-like DNA-binding protein